MNTLDPFLTDVESTAPLAAEDGEPVSIADPASRSNPNLQRNAVPLSGAALGIKDLAAGGILPGEN
jgi:hypothetical protein